MVLPVLFAGEHLAGFHFLDERVYICETATIRFLHCRFIGGVHRLLHIGGGRCCTDEFRRLYHTALHNKPKNVFKFLSQNLKTFLIQLLSLTLLHSYANIKEYCHIVFKGRGVVAALFVGYPYAIFGHIVYQ